MEVMTRIEQVFIDLNLVKGLKKNKLVEVIHKGKTTSWMTNIAMPISKEFNTRVTDLSLVPPLYDIWIYYRSQIKDIILDFGISYLPRHPWLPIMSASPIYGVPRILRYTSGLSPGILREVVPQVISVPYDPSSVKYEAKPDVNAKQGQAGRSSQECQLC
jgi:hypothetical protein